MTQRLQVRVPPRSLSSNNLEQVIYTRGAQANSAFHPSGVDKLSARQAGTQFTYPGGMEGLAGVRAGCVYLCRVEGNTV